MSEEINRNAIDEYIRVMNERQAANKLYNESLHRHQSNGLMGFAVGALVGYLFGGKRRHTDDDDDDR